MTESRIVYNISEARDRLRSAIDKGQRVYDALPEEMQMSPVSDDIETKIERRMDGLVSMDEAQDSLNALQFISAN